MATLLEISDNYRALLLRMEEWAEEHEGDISGFPLKEEIGGLEGDLKTKVLNIACLIKELKAEGAAIKDLGDSLVKRGAAKLNRAVSLKSYIEMNMPKDVKFEDTRAAVAWQKNGGVDAVELFPELTPDDLPEAFQVKTVTANTEAMRAAVSEVKGISSSGYPALLEKEGDKPIAVVYRGKHVRIR